MKNSTTSTHENYDRQEKIRLGSERNFGLTFAVLFLVLGAVPVFFGHPLRLWALILSGAFTALAFFWPSSLKYPNQYWLKFGLLLGKIVSPVVLGFLFFFVFWPTGLLLRLFGKDVLNLKWQPQAESYWIKSEKSLSTWRDQF